MENMKVDRLHFLSEGNEGLFLTHWNVITVLDANAFASIVWSLEND